MSDDMVQIIVNVILDNWRGTPDQEKESWFRNEGMYNAVFSKHNENVAAQCVFKAHSVTFPANMTHEMVVAAAKNLLRK